MFFRDSSGTGTPVPSRWPTCLPAWVAACPWPPPGLRQSDANSRVRDRPRYMLNFRVKGAPPDAHDVTRDPEHYYSHPQTHPTPPTKPNPNTRTPRKPSAPSHPDTPP